MSASLEQAAPSWNVIAAVSEPSLGVFVSNRAEGVLDGEEESLA